MTRELYKVGDLLHPISHLGDDWGFQPAGNYIFEVTAESDPPFSFDLFTIRPDPLPIRAPVPAPGVLALMLAGLAGLAVLRRRKITG